MEQTVKITLIGHESDAIRIVETALRTKPEYEVTSNYQIGNADSKVVSIGKISTDNVVILNLGNDWQEQLNSIKNEINLDEYHIIWFGPDDTQAMREAMRLGAYDYFSSPDQIVELNSVIEKVLVNLATKKETEKAESLVTTVINTAGGSGASFIAANLSHLFSTKHKQRVALLDMDLQFGCQALNLDMNLKYSLSEVLNNADKIDTTALTGFFSKHKSGLHILGEQLNDVVIPSEIPPNNIESLVDISKEAFNHVVIDLPRQIDGLFAACVAKSNRVILVMQQTLAHVRDTKRLLTILLQEFEIAPEHITVILNRYDEKNAITINDIEATINHRPLIILPNDYDKAVKATEIAKPLVEFSPNTELAKALTNISDELIGAPKQSSVKTTFFKRAVSAIVGG